MAYVHLPSHQLKQLYDYYTTVPSFMTALGLFVYVLPYKKKYWRIQYLANGGKYVIGENFKLANHTA